MGHTDYIKVPLLFSLDSSFFSSLWNLRYFKAYIEHEHTSLPRQFSLSLHGVKRNKCFPAEYSQSFLRAMIAGQNKTKWWCLTGKTVVDDLLGSKTWLLGCYFSQYRAATVFYRFNTNTLLISEFLFLKSQRMQPTQWRLHFHLHMKFGKISSSFTPWLSSYVPYLVVWGASSCL